MSVIWDYVNAISHTKHDLMTGTDNDKLAEDGYAPFLINRALSQTADTILYSNEMNINNHLDNKLQFDYLINTVRPKKRYAKWPKKLDNEALNVLMQYYMCNIRRAQEYMRLLSDEQVEKIKQSLIAGGMS